MLHISKEQRLLKCLRCFTFQCNKDRFDLQKAINTPINGISQSNAGQVSEKLCRVLAGHSVDIGSNRQVSARKHEAGVTFCKQLFAKKIVVRTDILCLFLPCCVPYYDHNYFFKLRLFAVRTLFLLSISVSKLAVHACGNTDLFKNFCLFSLFHC